MLVLRLLEILRLTTFPRDHRKKDGCVLLKVSKALNCLLLTEKLLMSLDKLQSRHVKLDHAFLSQKTSVALSTNRSQVKEVLPTGQVCADLSVWGIQ